MDDMMNRAAEALAKRRGVRIVDEVDYAQFAADARAVIEAMREPTDEMLGIGTRWMMFEPSRASSDLVRSGYSAMIDAALMPS